MRGTVNAREYLTPREIEEFNQDMLVAEKQADYGLEAKKLELQIKQMEVKWTQVFRLPFAVILLPVKLVMAFAVPIAVATKKDLPKEFWEFLRG